ncbi:MAG: hypothetical protein KGI25_06000 [Thaumarchaeota archaeon]|nr:hypothetical protein [Nitrososphaerota archaeon]
MTKYKTSFIIEKTRMRTKLVQGIGKTLIFALFVICITPVFSVPTYAQVTPNQGVIISSNQINTPIQFNKKVFSWTDRVHITIYAPDFNSDPNLIDTIGETQDDKISVCTTGHCIPYKLSETGTNTGIFSGYVDLTGDPTQKGAQGIDGAGENPSGTISTCNTICGPTNGMLPTTGNDGISVSFEYSRDQTVTGSALIRWHLGEIQWLQSNYPANGQGILQIIDPDMSINPDAINKFDTNVWSDSDSGGIKLTMTETDAGSGIFQGTVDFTTQYPSSGNRLHVSEGDVVTGEYIDRTLPPPASPADQAKLLATTIVGTNLPPLDRVEVSNPRIADSTGDGLHKITVGQQIGIVSDITNKMSKDQDFAYLVQVQDSNGIAVSLSWITGSLAPNQNMSLSQSWSPKSVGVYTAQIFVWEGVTNPNALSPPLTLQIPVS